ncbi:unnamed protein product [Symbiodinium sp. CCMP2592]|nr:unnamed protein product [Symbiodinium sp. CCMP2592]
MGKRVADLTDLPAQWESIRKLRAQAARGYSLFASTIQGQRGCLGSLKDCGANHEALKVILVLMVKSRTVETPAVDDLSEKVRAFFEEVNYPDKNSLAAVAHQDAWSAKRCLTTLKRKWIRHEDEKVRELVQLYDKIAQAGEHLVHRINTDEDIDGGAEAEDVNGETEGVEPEPHPDEEVAEMGEMVAAASESEADISGLGLLAALVSEAEEPGPEPCLDELEEAGATDAVIAMEVSASQAEPVVAEESSASRPEPMIAGESSASGPETVIAKEPSASGPEPVIAEEPSASGPEPVIAEESSASGPEPVIAEESNASRPEPVIAEESNATRHVSKVESGGDASVRTVARPLVSLEEKLAMSRAKLRAQLLNLCCDMMCAMMFFITKRSMALSAGSSAPEVIADSDDERPAPSSHMPVDEADTQMFHPDTQAIMGPLLDEELMVVSATTTESPPKPRQLFRAGSLGCEGDVLETAASLPLPSSPNGETEKPREKPLKEHKFLDLSPPEKVLTRSDQLSLKHSNKEEADGENDHGADSMPKKRGPGRPKGKAKAKASSAKAKAKASASKAEAKASASKAEAKASASKAEAKASASKPEPKVKAKAKAKGKACKTTVEASEASAVAASPVVSEPGFEEEPESSAKAVTTRRGAFKKRHVRVGRKGKKSKRSREVVESEETPRAPAKKARRSHDVEADVGSSVGAAVDVEKPSGAGSKKANPKVKAVAKAKAVGKVVAKPKALEKADAVPKTVPKKKAAPKKKAVAADSESGADGDDDGFSYPKTFAGRWCPKQKDSFGWLIWRYICKSFMVAVAPNIKDRSRSKKELEFFKLAKANFLESNMEIDSPDVKDFFEEQAEIYVRDWIVRFEARVQ